MTKSASALLTGGPVAPSAIAATERAVVGALGGLADRPRRLPAAPRHLSPEARAWFRDVLARYDVPAHHLANLEGAALALDRAEACRVTLAADGVVTVDRFGQPREHPAAVAERGYLVLHARLVRECGLDLAQPATPRLPTRWRDR